MILDLKPQQQLSQALNIPAPIDGLNAKDMLSNMAPTYALLMENVFPRFGGCFVRKGCQEWGV